MTLWLLLWCLSSCQGDAVHAVHTPHQSDSLHYATCFSLEHLERLKKEEGQRIAISSTTYVPFLKALGLDERIVAASWAKSIQDESLQKKVQNGTILNLTSGHGVDQERLIASGAQVLLYDPMEAGLKEMAEKLGLKAYAIQEYKEKHPVGRAEWIRYLGRIFDAHQSADSIMRQVVQEYNAIAKMSKTFEERPGVIIGSVYQGKWYAPGGESLVAQWIEDAGGSYLFSNKKGQQNVQIDMEEIILLQASVDLIGQIGQGPYSGSVGTLQEEHEVMVQGKIFYCNSTEVDYFGSAIMEPHIVLADLMAIFHPNQLLSHKPVYFSLVKNS